jgi:hypothetical protein
MATKISSLTLKAAKSIIIALLLGFITVFIIEHFGNFSYMEEASTDTSTQNEKLSFTRDIPLGTKVSRINLLTPFKTSLTFEADRYTVYDMYYSFQEYPNKAKYYFKASLKDYKYVVFIGLGCFILILLLTNYKSLKTIPKKLSYLREKRLSIILFFVILGLITIGVQKHYEFGRALEDLQIENDDLEYEINNLKSQNDNLEGLSKDCEFYKTSYSENNILVESDIEYGLLKKYSLIKYVVPDQEYDYYENGQLRVKYKVSTYKEYSELLKAQKNDLFMKYILLLNSVYQNEGLDHYYDYNPY